MKTPRILAFSGSLRADSYNQKLAALAAAAATEAGAEVTLVSLRDYRMPLFDEDLEKEEGMPESARKLKELFATHDGLIIASPEYNSTITAALKNAIDWVSRATSEGEPPLSVLRGKTAAILSASLGGYGGVRSLTQLRPFLENISISVLEDQVSVAKAHEAFTPENQLIDPALAASVKALSAKLVQSLS